MFNYSLRTTGLVNTLNGIARLNHKPKPLKKPDNYAPLKHVKITYSYLIKLHCLETAELHTMT